jgi:hypothetical protein
LGVGFDIDPTAIRKTATRKSDRMCAFAVDERQLQIAVDRAISINFHSMMGDDHPSSPPTSVI